MDATTTRGNGPIRLGSCHDDIAFALTGLGGSNAFGAGFLQAALDNNVVPKIISCTSGMIYWTFRYLEALRGYADERPGRLRRHLEDKIRSTEPYARSVDLMNTWRMMAMGVPGAFRWATPEYFARFRTSPLLSLDFAFPDVLQDLFLPAQMMVPLLPEKLFEDMETVFAADAIGVCFNTFLASTGTEYLHANRTAQAMLDAERARMRRIAEAHKPKAERTDRRSAAGAARPRRRSLARTAEAGVTVQDLKDALWLTQYGTHTNVGRGGFADRLDGAYLRSVILGELTMVDTILMPRPVAMQRRDFPSNYFEAEDFKTELWWNASCAPQVAAIEFINSLVEDGWLARGDKGSPGFREIQVVPVEIDVDRGYFAYFREDLETFDRGYDEACTAFARLWPPGCEEEREAAEVEPAPLTSRFGSPGGQEAA